MLKEFKPTILFLVKFGLIFGIGSFLYGKMLDSYQGADIPAPDPVTIWVSEHTMAGLEFFGISTVLDQREGSPYIPLWLEDNPEIGVQVFEGCNGLNIMILFIAFVVAFGLDKRAYWFIPLGLLSIHIFNILRIVALILIQEVSMEGFHLFHKYVFTAIIYAFVLGLWVLWARGGSSTKEDEPASQAEQ